MHTEAGDDINLRWVVPVTLLIEVDSLKLILLLLIKIAHLGENFRVAWNFSDENIVPLESFTSHSN